MTNLLARKPWLVIVLAFSLFVAGLAGFVVLAVKNEPRTIQAEGKPPARRSGPRDVGMACGVLAACVAGCWTLVVYARRQDQEPEDEEGGDGKP